MKLRSIALLILLTFSSFIKLYADEGMWLLSTLGKERYAEMKKLGLKLKPEDIYNVNKSSIKDAICQLGGFCTAEVISPKGLLITNHHCAYDAISSASSVENNYLDNGFWAKNYKEEIPVPGLTVSFLVRMEDVTDKVLKGVTDDGRAMKIAENIEKIEEESSEELKYNTRITPLFYENAYYLFVYEVYRDVRLVGAPPDAIGKFGGDTDNWMWPRHTGDFAFLRVYADIENKPADYSEKNVPYKPKHFLPVSTKGVKEGDFSMVLGFPGSTDRYITSYELKDLLQNEYPIGKKIMKTRLDIMKKDMDANKAVELDLASDHASLANYYKYVLGQEESLSKFDLAAEKRKLENKFQSWVEADEARKKEYGDVLKELNSTFKGKAELSKQNMIFNMAGFAPKFVINGIQVWRLKRTMKSRTNYLPMAQRMLDNVDEMFEDYVPATDQKITAATMVFMHNDLGSIDPEFFDSKYYKAKSALAIDNTTKSAEKIFKKSILTDKERMKDFLNDPSIKALDKDPGMLYVESIIKAFRTGLRAKQAEANLKIDDNMNLYIKGLMEMDPNLVKYPDANGTIRITYGNAGAYEMNDGSMSALYTYGSEMLAKHKEGDQEFDVPDKLQDLLRDKEFGTYTENGKLPVCFLTDNDITGGNSGSPVINGDGHLIGVAFDGNWESMMSDLYFMDSNTRTIAVDSRYVLFIVDKFAGAQRLLDEMTIVK